MATKSSSKKELVSSNTNAAKATIIKDPGSDKLTLLETALEQAGFWLDLEYCWQQSARKKAEFAIIVIPDFGQFNSFPSTITDPELVEHLVDVLNDRGFTQIQIGSSSNSAAQVLDNRDIYSLADLVGYGFATKKGRTYDIIDLADDTIEADFHEGSILADSTLSQAWMNANYRICFAKNKTDEENFYALGLELMLSVLPLKHKDYHYRHRFKSSEIVSELLQLTPVNFSLIDAIVSNHGNAGSRVEKPIATYSIIAANNILLGDMTAAKKMGLDPAASAITAAFIKLNNLPQKIIVTGPLQPYDEWINVHPLLNDSVRKRSKWSHVDLSLRPWLQSIDKERFPFKDLLNERINGKFLGYFDKLDENPGSFWLMVGFNYLLSIIHENLQSYRVILDKDNLPFREVSLGFTPDTYANEEYDMIPQELMALKKLLNSSKADDKGLRWQYLNKAVLFDFSHDIPVDYDDFICRVDISKAISYMNDYIGGVIVQNNHDRQKRVIRQAERNLYLPQPNYLALYQGDIIDVSKIERIRYSKNRQQMFWKTIDSENRSARYDDGLVTFSRLKSGDTRISVFGRQEFVLPPFWQAIDLNHFPEIKDVLVTHAYTTFFTRTMANFEATYEGREVRIGYPWDPEFGEIEDEAAIAALLMDYYERIQGAIEPYMADISAFITRMNTGQSAVDIASGSAVDEDGFTHIESDLQHEAGTDTHTKLNETGVLGKALKPLVDESLKFWDELGAAAQKDWGAYKNYG